LADDAAVFAAALSLWRACHRHADGQGINLSDEFSGVDQLMREAMRIANQFEAWACQHVDFKKLEEVWPYLLEDKFGEVCLSLFVSVSGLTEFDETNCFRAAMRLRLPIITDENLPVPVDVSAVNPVVGSDFKMFRIQTVRDAVDGSHSCPYTIDDEPFDEEYDPPYFGIYGVDAEGLLEFIAGRQTYVEALKLVRNFAPSIDLPEAGAESGF